VTVVQQKRTAAHVRVLQAARVSYRQVQQPYRLMSTSRTVGSWSRFAGRGFPGYFAEFDFGDFSVGKDKVVLRIFGILVDKVVPVFGQSVLTRRAGFALRFSEFDKVYRTEICVSVVLMIHL
jgi:hypothetical protein